MRIWPDQDFAAAKLDEATIIFAHTIGISSVSAVVYLSINLYGLTVDYFFLSDILDEILMLFLHFRDIYLHKTKLW